MKTAYEAWGTYLWHPPTPGGDVTEVVGQAFRDGFRSGVSEMEDEVSASAEPEPVDTFDADYPDYDNNSYLDGYTDGATSRTDTLTIIVPVGLRFTLTVN